MKKIIIILLFLTLLPQLPVRAEETLAQPAGAVVKRNGDTADLSWQNPDDPAFSATVVFRSTIPIEDYFSYRAVAEICDKIYEGIDEKYFDTGLAVNLPYYYILFARDSKGSSSRAIVLATEKDVKKKNISSLSGSGSAVVNDVTLNEAGIVYSYNNGAGTELDDTSRRLALFIIVKSPHDLSETDKNAISYFIHAGTPTTILLGSGERTGVLNSYLSVFSKLPRSILEWQDIIKIANGRWPNQRNQESEDRAANIYFSAIYERNPDMNNPFDNAAVTVIAYGLRPAARNLESEEKAISIFKSIFNRPPVEATDWDLVRAIAYSGATRR